VSASAVAAGLVTLLASAGLTATVTAASGGSIALTVAPATTATGTAFVPVALTLILTPDSALGASQVVGGTLVLTLSGGASSAASAAGMAALPLVGSAGAGMTSQAATAALLSIDALLALLADATIRGATQLGRLVVADIAVGGLSLASGRRGAVATGVARVGDATGGNASRDAITVDDANVGTVSATDTDQ